MFYAASLIPAAHVRSPAPPTRRLDARASFTKSIVSTVTIAMSYDEKGAIRRAFAESKPLTAECQPLTTDYESPGPSLFCCSRRAPALRPGGGIMPYKPAHAEQPDQETGRRTGRDSAGANQQACGHHAGGRADPRARAAGTGRGYTDGGGGPGGAGSARGAPQAGCDSHARTLPDAADPEAA